MNNNNEPIPMQTWAIAIKSVIKRNGVFLISQATLDELRYGRQTKTVVFAPEFEDFKTMLDKEKLRVVLVNTEMSVIKPV